MKGKGGSGGMVAPRYRPASEFDDATLAQKREYWRTKKREQRARLSERKHMPSRRREENVQHLDVSAVLNSSLSSTSTPPQGKGETYRAANVSSAPQSVTGAGESSAVEASQRQKWFKTLKLNNVLPRSPASGPIAAKTAVGSSSIGVKRLSTWGAVSRSFTSVKSSGARFANSSAVPPFRVTVPPSGTAPGKAQLGMAMTNGSSSKTTPQPPVAMQDKPVPKAQCTAQVVVCIQPKTVTANVTTKMSASSSLGPGPFKVEDSPGKTTPTIVQKSATVAILGNKGTDKTQAIPESEEEKLAKRREQWRIKKREQRAKQAARIKSREKTPQTRQIPQRAGANNGVVKPLPPAMSCRAVSQQPCVTRFKTQLASGRRLLSNPQVIVASPLISQHASVAVKKEMADFVPTNLVHLNQGERKVKLRVDNPHVEKPSQTATTSGVMLEKKPGEITRKLYTHFSNTSRGMARCRTPRQRFIETQRSFLSHRNTRGKFSSHAAVYNTRNIPKPDPNESPEQTAARRREYWRIKKREQRAKLSAEVKNKLKEKDSLMRRVKRYQNILEEMRRARALACSTVTQPAGGTLSHASDAIGGFIKEDGTVTINIPSDPTVAGSAVKEEEDRLPVNNIITRPHDPLQPKPGGSGSVVNVPLHSPPFRPSQVKVSFPLAGRSVNRTRRLVSVKPRAQVERTKSGSSSHTFAIQNPTQIKLAHPQSLCNPTSGGSSARPGLGGCVMKMAVLNPGLAAAGSGQLHSLDPELREEERMAKKREYWRIKKREQRAARDARLRQGLMLARSNAATLQRRKNQKLGLVNNVTPSTDIITNTVNNPPIPNSSVPNTPQPNIVKEERESIKCEPDTSPDIKPPPSPGPQPDTDPALSAESQATTLLAVASMKKLLEESLSTVTECKTEQEDVKPPEICCKSEVEQEIKTDIPLNTGVRDKLPVAAELTLESKDWQVHTDDALAHGLKESPQTSETLPPLPPLSSNPSPPSTLVELSDSQSSPPSCRVQRLCIKVDRREVCLPEPPKLHHLPLDGQTQHCEQQRQTQQQGGRQNPPLPQQDRRPAAVDEQNHMTSLQKKREYWKLMKRQQRARSKAGQKEGCRPGEYSRRLYPKTVQVSDLIVKRAQVESPPSRPALQPKPSTFTSAGVHNIPTVLIVSPTASTVGRSPDMLQVKPPVTSFSLPPVQRQNEKSLMETPRGDGSNLPSGSGMAARLLLAQHEKASTRVSPAGQTVGKKWPRQAQDNTEIEDMAPVLPTLTPPENPLSSINLQPIEPPGCTATFAPLKILCVRPQSPQNTQLPATKLTPISTMAPPKRFAGETEEGFLIRKREYWRVKKKEQRARKAIRDRDLTQRRGSSNWRPLLPAQGLPRDLEIKDPGQWVNSSDESEHLMSTSSEADYFPFPSYTMPIEDDSDMLFDDGHKNEEEEEGDDDGDDGSGVSDAVWRSRYLMDHDPLNQLLVCMVCGDLQYSHCVEAVRAHIEEAHAETLSLEAPERRRILEAWDEQVSQRERFFTSQLQQQSGPLAGAHRS